MTGRTLRDAAVLKRIAVVVLAIFAGVTAYLAIHSYNGNGPDSILSSVLGGVLVATAVCFPRRFAITVGHMVQTVGSALEVGGYQLRRALNDTGNRVGYIINQSGRGRVHVEVENYDALGSKEVGEQVEEAAMALQTWIDTETERKEDEDAAAPADTLPVASAAS